MGKEVHGWMGQVTIPALVSGAYDQGFCGQRPLAKDHGCPSEQEGPDQCLTGIY